MPDALPAVTVPSFEKAGFSFATSPASPRPDVFVVVDDVSPLRVLIVTGAISSANLPASERPRPGSAS